MKADRLLAALLLLQAHGRLSTRVLSERLEVSQRTAHRDMESLAAAGVPVFALRGAQGGWELEDGWRLRVPGFAEDELRALLMSQPRVAGSSSLAMSAERALTKLTAALPDAMRERVASIRQRLHVDPSSWYGSQENLSALPIVQDAVSSDRMLRMIYHPPGRDPAERRVGPLGLVAKGTTWYLVARAPNGLRTYRVSRIVEPVILDEVFKRPHGFDLASYWKTSTEAFSNTFHYPTRLRLEPAAAASIRLWCRVLTEAPASPPDADGRITLAIDFDGEHHATFVVLGFGPRVEVVEPSSLRERVAGEVAAMYRLSRSDPGPADR